MSIKKNIQSARHHITVIGYEYDPDCSFRLPFIPVRKPALPQSWLRSYLFSRAVNQILAKRSYHIVHSHVNGWSADVDVLHVRSVNYRWLEKKRIHLSGSKRTVVVSGSIKTQIQAAHHTQQDIAVIPPMAILGRLLYIHN